MRKLLLFLYLAVCIGGIPALVSGQPTFPVNGVAEPKDGHYAFTNAIIILENGEQLKNATMIIKNGKIQAIGQNVSVPADAAVIDCSGKYIYPSFIDVYSDYGVEVDMTNRPAGGGFGMAAQLENSLKGALGWNEALKADVDAYKIFSANPFKAEALRAAGFGTVLTHRKDGIARGTGAVVTLADLKENFTILKEKASAHYSFNRGTSRQSYPSSMMGSIALLRQTHYDAQWYKNAKDQEGVNITLQAWNENLSLPQIFEANDKWNAIRADRIGDEFGIQYIIKAGGNEYQRIKEIKATNASFILPLNFPDAYDVEDPEDARFISLADMKHWELAPINPATFEKEGIKFYLTASDLRDPRQFLANLRKAIQYGLSEKAAFEALTKNPAELLGIYDKVGSLSAGKLANFIITSAPIFESNAVILQNWVQGKKHGVKEDEWSSNTGWYTINLKGALNQQLKMEIGANNTVKLINKDTLSGRITSKGSLVTIQFPLTKGGKNLRLSGVASGNSYSGTGLDDQGRTFTWTAVYSSPSADQQKRPERKPDLNLGKITYPLNGYGFETLPVQETILIKNATVWTNEKEGILQNTDVLVRNGKIEKIGKNLSASGARVIDGTGKHLTPGIIDEHSHIATSSVNEGGQSVTSEVRIGDNLNPDDINIYRQLSGGVTSSHILHGSANTIGGQTQLIKLRWGADDEGLKFRNWNGFIKFALGENVKRTTSTNNVRYPDTRMGVEQVLQDAFARATAYKAALAAAEANNKKKGATPVYVRRDLELDALVEIMDKKRFITCHSYVQSEITAAMRVADKYGFKFQTFTHILEGYKVADKMKEHGSNVSTFADWWAYKNEVMDAIPYNAYIMHSVGLNVCINSDDAEMARRLNQEAAKSIKYGGMSEEDALKMVTLNPAKALMIDDRVGSIKVGKDADLVLWSDNPVSIYAVAEKTIVDGIVYFDRERDLELRKQIAEERNRLIQKMAGEKRSGAPVQPARASMEIMFTCSEHQHNHGLLVVDADNLDAEDISIY